MIHKINDAYCYWLLRYSERQECHHKSAALSLMAQLKAVRTLAAFQRVLNSFPTPPHVPSFFQQDSSDYFFPKLSEVMLTVNQLSAFDLPTLCQQLDRLDKKEQTKDLISLLHEVLTTEEALLHENMLSLLNKLADLDKVQDIMNHLALLDQKERPKIPVPGSFDALVPRNKTHSTCLDLLRNNAATFCLATCKNTTIWSTEANNLLQTLLGIYYDLHTPASDTQQKKNIPETKTSDSSCIIL